MPEPRSAIVTGAASGLGRAIAVRLARNGWRIALADCDAAGSRETLEQVRAAGGDGRIEHLDVSQPEAWQQLRDRLRADWTRLDLLVNNAGVGCSGEVGRFSLDNWRWSLDINLFGAIYGCHTMIEWLKENRQGAHIVNVASVAAIVSAPSMAAYNVAKAGIVALSETLYAELRNDSVGVTVVCPGFFATQLLERGRFDADFQQAIARERMLAASLTADDVAEQVIRAVSKKQLYAVMPLRARGIWYFKRIMPRTVLKLIGSAYGSAKRVRMKAKAPAQQDCGESPSICP